LEKAKSSATERVIEALVEAPKKREIIERSRLI